MEFISEIAPSAPTALTKSMTPATAPTLFWSRLTGHDPASTAHNLMEIGPVITKRTPETPRPARSFATSGHSKPKLPFGYHMPDEILLETLKYHLPEERAYTVSNNDDIDFCPTTLTSLLQTSLKIKHEVLRRTKNYPLHINITSGNGCPCQQLEDANDILKTSFGKATQLPLWAWSEIIVTFSPTLHQSADDACKIDLGHKYSPQVMDLVLQGQTVNIPASKLTHSVDCVLRQSAAFAQTMQRLTRTQQTRHQTSFRFVFDGSKGLDNFEEQYNKAIWDLQLIREILHPWRWTTSPGRAMPSIKFPYYLSVGLDVDGGFFNQGKDLSQAIRERFEEEMVAWWNRKSPRYGRYIWNWDDTDRGYEESYSDAIFYAGPLKPRLCTIVDMEI